MHWIYHGREVKGFSVCRLPFIQTLLWSQYNPHTSPPIILQVGMEEDCCQRVVSQLCGALSHLHSLGFVHRDIKPENVFLCDSACRWVKLGDFGMVSIPHSASLHCQKMVSEKRLILLAWNTCFLSPQTRMEMSQHLIKNIRTCCHWKSR